MYRMFAVLDELVTLVEEAWGVPLTTGCVVPREHLLELLDELRNTVPGDVEHAQDVLDRRDELLGKVQRDADVLVAAARSRADQIETAGQDEARRLIQAGEQTREQAVQAGRAEQDRLVSQSEVVQAAHIEAARIVATACAAADAARADCDDYIDCQLDDVQNLLDRLSRELTSGHPRLFDKPASER